MGQIGIDLMMCLCLIINLKTNKYSQGTHNPYLMLWQAWAEERMGNNSRKQPKDEREWFLPAVPKKQCDGCSYKNKWPINLFTLHKYVSVCLLPFFNFPATFNAAHHVHFYPANSHFYCWIEGTRSDLIYFRPCTQLETILNSTFPRNSMAKEKHISCIPKCLLK